MPIKVCDGAALPEMVHIAGARWDAHAGTLANMITRPKARAAAKPPPALTRNRHLKRFGFSLKSYASEFKHFWFEFCFNLHSKCFYSQAPCSDQAVTLSVFFSIPANFSDTIPNNPPTTKDIATQISGLARLTSVSDAPDNNPYPAVDA